MFEEFDFDDSDQEATVVKEKKSDDKLLKEPVSLRRHVTWPARQGDDAVMSVKVQKEHKEVKHQINCQCQGHTVNQQLYAQMLKMFDELQGADPGFSGGALIL